MENRGISFIHWFDIVHVEGYVIDLHNSNIIHVDLLQLNNSNNATLRLIADMLFGDEKVTYEFCYKCSV